MPSFVEGLKAGLDDRDECKIGCFLGPRFTALIGAPQVIEEPELGSPANLAFLGVLH